MIDDVFDEVLEANLVHKELFKRAVQEDEDNNHDSQDADFNDTEDNEGNESDDEAEWQV